MDIPQRTMNAVGKRDESIRRWMNSSTAKATQKTDDTHFQITFDNGSMLLSAVSSGDIEEVERLLQLGSDVNFASADGLTALHQACIDESIELVEVLINHGAYINARDNEGWTPLHAAASTTSLEVVSFLVNHGANLSAVNTDGELAVDLADEDDIKNFLMEKITANNINLASARNLEHDKMMSDINAWISKGVVDEIRDPQGASALHVAASKSYMDIMELLVDKLQMDVNIRDNDGWTPLHAAVYWKQLDAVAFLIDHNADYQAKTSIGLIPLDLADEDIILKYKAFLRKKNLVASYAKKSNSDDSDGVSPEVFPHSYKPQPSPILKKLPENTNTDVAPKPALPPTAKHPPVSAAKPTLPPTRPQPAAARPIPLPRKDLTAPKPPDVTSVNKDLKPTGATSSTVIKLPPRTTTTTTTTSNTASAASSILPPKPNISTSAGSSIPLPQKPVNSSILPPSSKPTVLPHPPSAARPPALTSAKSQKANDIPRPTVSAAAAKVNPYTFKTLDEALEEIQKLNKMVENYKKELANIESQLNAFKKSAVTSPPSTSTRASNIDSVLAENQRLQKENATLIKAMSTLQKSKPKL